MYPVAEEPGPVRGVEDVEEAGGEPVCEDRGEDGEEGVGEGGEEGGGGGVVNWVDVEDRVVVLRDGRRCRGRGQVPRHGSLAHVTHSRINLSPLSHDVTTRPSSHHDPLDPSRKQSRGTYRSKRPFWRPLAEIVTALDSRSLWFTDRPAL